jgi:hypothetical protein
MEEEEVCYVIPYLEISSHKWNKISLLFYLYSLFSTHKYNCRMLQRTFIHQLDGISHMLIWTHLWALAREGRRS